MKLKALRKSRGQSTIEYVLMVAFGAVLSIQVAKYFNEVFRDGFARLERNVQTEVESGKDFGASN